LHATVLFLPFSPGVHYVQPRFPLRPDYSGLRFNFLLLLAPTVHNPRPSRRIFSFSGSSNRRFGTRELAMKSRGSVVFYLLSFVKVCLYNSFILSISFCGIIGLGGSGRSGSPFEKYSIAAGIVRKFSPTILSDGMAPFS